MKCPDDETLEGFADGELDDALWAEVERHIDACEPCRERFGTIGRTDAKVREALTALKASAPPMALTPARAKARLLSMPLAVAAAAAIVVAVAAGGIWLFMHRAPAQEHVAPPLTVATNTPPAPARLVAMETEALLPVPILTAEAAAAMRNLGTGDPEEDRRRLATLRDTAPMTDMVPEWRIERLRRLLLYTRGILPVDNG